MRVEIDTHERLEVGILGYGDHTSEDGHGSPIYIERDPEDGKMYLHVWSDINSEDPTHRICLEGARNSNRKEDAG